MLNQGRGWQHDIAPCREAMVIENGRRFATMECAPDLGFRLPHWEKTPRAGAR